MVGILLVASTTEITGDELTLLQALAGEGRSRSTVSARRGLAEALERERIVARIARKVRSESISTRCSKSRF